MQNERSTRRRVRIGDNLYERHDENEGDRRYEVGYADVNGGWRMKTLRARTRTEARAERERSSTKLRRGEIAPPRRSRLLRLRLSSLTRFERLVVAGERAARTLERYRSALDLHVIPIAWGAADSEDHG